MRLAGDALDRCRRRIQQAIHGPPRPGGDPLYRARRTLHTGIDLLTDKQQLRLETLFADDEHVQVEATWGIYQRMITAYREPERARGRQLMVNADRLTQPRRPAPLTELITLGRTLKKRAVDVLAYFDRPGASNGPTEAINGTARTPPRLRPRLPQPHQLHRPMPTRSRRIQTPTTPSILKSRQSRVSVGRSASKCKRCSRLRSRHRTMRATRSRRP